MIDQLIALDKELFLSVNQGMSNAFFDWLMPILRNRFTWAPLYLFIIIFSVKNYKREGFMMIRALLLNFAISDSVSSKLVKNSIQRLRPCNDIELREQMVQRVRCSGGYSFTSSHATNHFAMAVLLIILFYRRWKHVLWLALLWAASISFAQIYVGVHYPLDILAGALLGVLIGLTSGFIYNRIRNKWMPETQ
ncbi:MAG TPA: phosphatase PAP2 family protein [Sphingobacteriaceae bacterium]|nr:phosphatase PAP2 family protein [Sphingobacteriaceae bacterium]